LPASAAADSVATLQASFDNRFGGWGRAPKFPQPMTIEFLLRHLAAVGPGADPAAAAMVRTTLDRMAAGGVRDQLGGGFHRYSTDAQWLVPHFEQMLYDNAQLGRAYLHAWQLLGEHRDREVACATLDAIVRDFTTADRGLAASRDADTNGVEGATFTWTPTEIGEALPVGDPDVELAQAAWDVTSGGNWHEAHGRTILRRVRTDPELAEQFGLSIDEVPARLEQARAGLLAARDRRPQPNRDDKVLAGWNGLAIAALAEGASALDAAGDTERADPPPTAGALARAVGRRIAEPQPLCDARLADGSRVNAPPGCASTACWIRTGAWDEAGRMAAQPARASSRITPAWPMAFSRSTRRRSTRAGSGWPERWPTRSSTASAILPAASSTQARTTRS